MDECINKQSVIEYFRKRQTSGVNCLKYMAATSALKRKLFTVLQKRLSTFRLSTLRLSGMDVGKMETPFAPCAVKTSSRI